MQIPKFRLTFAVIVILVAASMRLSFAPDGVIEISRLHADAIQTCSTAAAKFPGYS